MIDIALFQAFVCVFIILGYWKVYLRYENKAPSPSRLSYVAGGEVREPDSAGGGKGEVRLLSYNIQWLPHMKKDVNELLRHIKPYDVVCLQECFTGVYNSKQARLECLAKFGGYSIVTCGGPAMQSAKLLDSGLVICSRYPVLESRFTPFMQSCRVDQYANKGILYAKLDSPVGHLHVYNTHLQASYEEEYAIHPVRWSQIKQFVNEVPLQSNDAMVVCGDFNVDINMEHNKDTMRHFFQNMCAMNMYIPPAVSTNWARYTLDGNIQHSSSTVQDPHYVPQVLDYFFAKNMRVIAVDVHRCGSFSDHLAVELITASRQGSSPHSC